MATAAFKSTTKRAPITGTAEDAGSSNRTGNHRRSRSLSRYSGRVPPSPAESDELPAPRGRFVNTVRGSGFPEISLDDLADEFFRAKEEEEEEQVRTVGRSGRRVSDISPRTEIDRRGRSVSRYRDRMAAEGNGILGNNGVSKGVPDSSIRRRRSVSVARSRCSDPESDMDLSQSYVTQTKPRSFGNGSFQQPSLHKPVTSSRLLRRSYSQKDLLKSHDSYSNQSSALTDDEIRDVRASRSGTEKTIRAVYAQKKTEHPTGDGEGTGLFEAMRKEVRHAVEEIRTELEKVMVKATPTAVSNGDDSMSKGSNVVQAVVEIRRNYTTKLEQSEKRKQDLLAELAFEEQRGQELTKIVRELLPEPKQTAPTESVSRPRRRSNDRNRVSKRLTEEAEKYFEDFISNVEDTDISSYDGERSDTSSTIGGATKLRDPVVHNTVTETHAKMKVASLPVETDGVILPWLQWETSNDGSPSACKSKIGLPLVSGTNLCASQEVRAAHDNGNCLTSSRGSWSPGGNDSFSVVSRDKTGDRSDEVRSYLGSSVAGGSKGSSFDMDEYAHLQRSEELLFEMLSQRRRIDSGSLILCGRTFM